MSKQRKDTPKRRKNPVKADLVVKFILALGTLLTGLAALIQALKH